MSKDRPPIKHSSSRDISQFLQQSQQLSPITASAGRLLFGLDATASRQASWDRASHLQAEMFKAAQAVAGLQIQLCYYRGFREFHCSPWTTNSEQLQRLMSGVQCLGGYTQILRILEHCLQEQHQQRIQACVLVGDAVEESVDKLCAKAGELGLLGVPLFIFQEGRDPSVKNCFQQMAKLSKGAYASFDEASAAELVDLLCAAATYASGGFSALQRLQSSAARQLLLQLDQ